MRKLIIILLVVPFLSSCATVNFSSKYYTPPSNYDKDIAEAWNEILIKVPLKNKSHYSYRIVKDKETKPAGMPQSIKEGDNFVILVPEYYIKYVYEFYYPNYHKIIMCCLFSHELGHPESGYSSDTIPQHILCDKYTIEHLLIPTVSPVDYYSTLVISAKYFSARKGLGGHAFNIGWNILNAATFVFVGYGYFNDWYANDINKRLYALRRSYPGIKFSFKRN
jgi:hypothetical protein